MSDYGDPRLYAYYHIWMLDAHAVWVKEHGEPLLPLLKVTNEDQLRQFITRETGLS